MVASRAEQLAYSGWHVDPLVLSCQVPAKTTLNFVWMKLAITNSFYSARPGKEAREPISHEAKKFILQYIKMY